MNLGVSNLAWAPEDDAAARALLTRLGVTAIEVAPTRIAPWAALDHCVMRDYRSRWSDAGLALSSLQAIFFEKPEAQLLGDGAGFAAMCEHLRRISTIAQELGARVAVFGAPRNRNRGKLDSEGAISLAAERLHVLGEIASEGGLVLGMEPVPHVYGSDFMTGWAEMLRVVALCGHPNVRAHLDTACVGMVGDSITAAVQAAGSALCHFHASEAWLGPFTIPEQAHTAAAAALYRNAYSGFVVIEMKQVEADGLVAIAEAVRFVQSVYSDVDSKGKEMK